MSYTFHCAWSSLESMCIELIVLFLENTELFYVLLFICLEVEILAVSSLFKCVIAIKCSESRVETLQIFFFRPCHFLIQICTGWYLHALARPELKIKFLARPEREMLISIRAQDKI